MDLFLLKTPDGLSVSEIREHVLAVDGVRDAHHIHLWSLDGNEKLITMHVVTEAVSPELKHNIRAELQEHGIFHSTIEYESPEEVCEDRECCIGTRTASAGEGPHHHHHHP